MGVASSTLDPVTRAIVALAAEITDGDASEIAARSSDAIAAGTPPLAIDELILQSVLTVGWPRALVAAGVWRTLSGAPPEHDAEDLDYGRHAEWTARGERVCRIIYGDHYARLRENVRQLHPALEAWMVTEGYGRTLARPGLDLKTRELCTVAQTAVLRTARQLHSHLLGALRSGASCQEVEGALDVIRPRVSPAWWSEILALWRRVRERWEPA